MPDENIQGTLEQTSPSFEELVQKLNEETAKKIADFSQQLETISQENTEIKAQLKTVLAENATLKGSVLKENAEKKKPTKYDKAVEIDGKSYKFNHVKANIPGVGIVTSEDAAADEELQAKIIAIPGQNFLTEVK